MTLFLPGQGGQAGCGSFKVSCFKVSTDVVDARTLNHETSETLKPEPLLTVSSSS